MQLIVNSGQLPVGWEIKKLDELCEIARGGSPRPIKQFITNDPDGVNWIKISDASSSSKYIYETKEKIKPIGIKHSRLVNEGDFILSNSMSFGRPYIMRTSGCIHDGWLVLKDKSGLFDQDYLYYFLGSNTTYKQFDRLAAGSTVRNLNIDLVRGVKVILPPLPEQKRIVAILDEAFEGIDSAIANTEKNLANSRELFESYLNAVFSKKGKGWEEKDLGDIAELIDSLHKTPSYIDEDGFPMVRVTDIKSGVLNLNNARRVDNSTFVEFSKRHTPKIGDIVFSRVGSYGVPALVESDELFCLGQNTVFILPQINSQFLYFFLRSHNSQQQIEKFVAGTTQGTISLKSIKKIRVPIPPCSEQLSLALEISYVLRNTQRLEAIYRQKLAALKELKQSILQKAFTGELTADTPKTVKEEIAA